MKDMTIPADSLVSIITPSYNAARFIDQTVDSVLQQTYPDWELLIVDDCSRDHTREILARLAGRDARIRPVFQEKNGGPAAARNAGLSRAQGRYIAFLDADDLWLPRKLERQLAFMQAQDAALSYTGYRRIREDGSGPGRLIQVPPGMNYRQLLKNTAIATSTVIVDRSKSGPFEMVQTYYDDYALWLMLLKRKITACGLQEDLMRYRVVRKSVSRHKINSARWVWRTYRQIEHLSLPDAAWCFMNYVWNAYSKYARF